MFDFNKKKYPILVKKTIIYYTYNIIFLKYGIYTTYIYLL